jgi:uncharacterized protein YdhG (YjbR/CyaY superfamily)
MKSRQAIPKDINEYIARFSRPVQAKLQQVRRCIRLSAPGATEKIAYHIPTFFLRGNLVHFAACANHIGFYPGAAAIRKFARELAAYETAKGTVQFPLDEPVPADLIARIVRFRVSAASTKRAPRKAGRQQ